MSEAATSPQQAPPRAGMRRIPFPTESYEHPSHPLISKRLLNFLVEESPADARTQTPLVPTTGLVPSGHTFGTGPVVAMNTDQPGYIYLVSGTHLYRYTEGPDHVVIINDLGDVGVIAGDDYPANLMVTIAVGVLAVVVCVPPNAFTCDHASPVVNQIGGDFPGARSVTYIDGYFVFTSTDLSAQFFISRLLDPSDYDALDFAYADGVPNIIRRVITHRGELWVTGDGGIEVWYNSGDQDFPFRRRAGGAIRYGVASPKTVVVIDGSVFWVTIDGFVVRSQGYQAVRVSNHAVERTIRAEGTAAILWALGYAQAGHTFYVLSLGARTMVYDCATKMWHDRSSSADGSTVWRPRSIGQLGEFTLFGDSLSGRTLRPDITISTDDGVNVLRQMTTPPLWAGTNRAFMSRLEVEMEVGGASSPGDIQLQWSDDGGITFGPARTLNAGTLTQLRKRVFTTRLGSFRQRVFRISAHGHATLYAIDADVVAGAGG